MVMIVVDLSQPWAVMDSLEQWVGVVRKHINSLSIPPQELKEMEENSEWRGREGGREKGEGGEGGKELGGGGGGGGGEGGKEGIQRRKG